MPSSDGLIDNRGTGAILVNSNENKGRLFRIRLLTIKPGIFGRADNPFEPVDGSVSLRRTEHRLVGVSVNHGSATERAIGELSTEASGTFEVDLDRTAPDFV